MGKCRQVKKLPEGIVVTWGGNVMFAMCPACFPESGIKMIPIERDGKRGVAIGHLREAEQPPDILPISHLSQVNDFVSKDALAKYESMPMDNNSMFNTEE